MELKNCRKTTEYKTKCNEKRKEKMREEDRYILSQHAEKCISKKACKI